MTTKYLGLHYDDPTIAEVSAPEYRRAEVVLDDEAKKNQTMVSFPTARSFWGDITYFGLYDAPTGGAATHYGKFVPPISVKQGIRLSILPNALEIFTPTETPPAGAGEVEIFDEGVPIGKASSFNFVGAEVLPRVDSGGRVTIYIPPPALAITTFASSIVNAEVGSTYTEVTLSWEYTAPAIASQTVSCPEQQVVTWIPTHERRVLVTDVLIMETTRFTLSSADPYGSQASRTVTIPFLHRVYWGRGSEVAPEAENMNSLLRQNRTNGFEFVENTGTDEEGYIWIAWPVAYGGSTNFIDPATGFDVSFEPPMTVNVTNRHGHTEPYYFFRSSYRINGEIGIST